VIVIGGGVDPGVDSLTVGVGCDRGLDADVLTGSEVAGAGPLEDEVQAAAVTATIAATNAANARIRLIEALCTTPDGPATAQRRTCGWSSPS
jgi:hypothetical protein